MNFIKQIWEFLCGKKPHVPERTFRTIGRKGRWLLIEECLDGVPQGITRALDGSSF